MNIKHDVNIPNDELLAMLQHAIAKDVRICGDADFDEFRSVHYGGMMSSDHIDEDDYDSELLINLGKKANVLFSFSVSGYYQNEPLQVDFICSGVAQIMSYAKARHQALVEEDILIDSVKVALVSDVELEEALLLFDGYDFFGNSATPETKDILPLIDWVFKLTKWGDLDDINDTVFDDMSHCYISPVLAAKQRHA